MDYQSRLATSGRHTFTFGAGIRRSSDSTRPSSLDSLTPLSETEFLYSAFLHDTIGLKPNLKLLLGSKFEHNEHTGWEILPNAQLLYTPTPRNTYWASVSRSVVTPSRVSGGLRAELAELGPPPRPPLLVLFGNPNLKSAEVVAHEIGTRLSLHDNLFLDVTGFYNEYKNLQTLEQGAPFTEGTPPQTINPLIFGNNVSGQTAGVEAALRLKPASWWNVSATYALFSERFRLSPLSTENGDPYGGRSGRRSGRGGAARHQFQLHSYIDLPHHFEFDNDFYYVGALVSGEVPAYMKLDTRIGWSPSKSLQLSLGIRNALSPHHLEAADPLSVIEEAPRSIYFRAVWHF